jgi:hypothetical protein
METTKEDIKDFLIEEAEYSTERVEEFSNFQLFTAWLQYNGIIGYADDILDTIEAIYDVKLQDR